MQQMQKSRVKKPIVQNPLNDNASERLILSGLLRYGSELYYDLATIINENDFFFPENQLLYSTITKLVVDHKVKDLDTTSLLTHINTIDPTAISRYALGDYIPALKSDETVSKNIHIFAKRIAKLSITRKLKSKLNECIQELDQVTGDESVLNILAKAEKPISDFTVSLISHEETLDLSSKLLEYMNYLAVEQPPNRGLPSGFPLYDYAIGGGFIKPGVHVLGGRAGSMKSMFGLNVANNMVTQKIPVLFLDTELTSKITMNRWMSLISGIPINFIETGEFAKSKGLHEKLDFSVRQIQNKFHYHNISGLHYMEWISIMRRWVMREVGFGPDGSTNPCLIIVDYIKLMDLTHVGDFQEYQYLGQLMTDLHNFCIKYDLPMFALCQLNRDGIEREDQGVFAGSDRIMGLASSAAILKTKQESDYASCPLEEGNKKLVVVKSRFGPGTQPGEYINLKADGAISKIVEGQTNVQVRQRRDGIRIQQ